MTGTVTYEQLMATMQDIKRQIGTWPVGKYPVDMRMVEDPGMTRFAGHWIETIRIVKNPRSKRLWKKLVKRRRERRRAMMLPIENVYWLRGQNIIVGHPDVLAAMKRRMAYKFRSELRHGLARA